MPKNDYIEQIPVQRSTTYVRTAPVEAMFKAPLQKLSRQERKQERQNEEIAREIIANNEIRKRKEAGVIEDLPLQQEHPSLYLLPFGVEAKAVGLGRGLLRTAGGLAAGHVGSELGYQGGKKVDEVLGTRAFAPVGSFVGSLLGYTAGSAATDNVLSRFSRKPLVSGTNGNDSMIDDQIPRYNSSQITGHFGEAKYYGPTMGKTTAAAKNPRLVDFDDLIREPSKTILDRFGFKSKAEMYNSGNQEAIKAYEDMLVKTLQDGRANPQNQELTLMASPTAVANPQQTGFYFDNVPSIPSREVFISRNIARGATPESSALWYDSLIERNPNLKIDNRYVSKIEKFPYQKPQVYEGIEPQEAFMSEEIPVKNFERLVRHFPVTGEGNAELGKAAGVDMSKFPKGLPKKLGKLMDERFNNAIHGKRNSIINLIRGMQVSPIFNYKSSQLHPGLGHIDLEPVGDDLGIRYIEKLQKMSDLNLPPFTVVGTNAGRQYANLLGKRLISGRELLNPKATVNHISTYFKTNPVLEKVGDNFRPIPGAYHEEDLREAIVRQGMQNNPGKMLSDKEFAFLFSKANEGGMTALEDGYLNVSSFPEYFDETGHFRSDLPEDFADELSIYLSEGRPGFYQRYIGPLKRPLPVSSKLISPFIHPNVYLYPGEHPNLGIFSTFKKGGKLNKE